MTRECMRSEPWGLMVRRRASQQSRSAVSMLITPAPSMNGGSSSLRCTITVVGLRRTPSPRLGWVASVTRASAQYWLHSSTGLPAFLSAARIGLAMSQIACSNASPCSSGNEPLNLSSRAPPVQVIRNPRRAYKA